MMIAFFFCLDLKQAVVTETALLIHITINSITREKTTNDEEGSAVSSGRRFATFCLSFALSAAWRVTPAVGYLSEVGDHNRVRYVCTMPI